LPRRPSRGDTPMTGGSGRFQANHQRIRMTRERYLSMG
jgi:hypothetical protein